MPEFSTLGPALQDITIVGSGATARSLKSRMQDIPCVFDWNVKGDGVSDDRAAIQQAANASSALFFPPNRKYIIDGGLTMRVGAQWSGLGMAGDTGTPNAYGAAKLVFTGTATACIRNNNPLSPLASAGISGLTIMSEGDYPWIMDLNHPTSFRMRDVRLSTTGLSTGGIRGERLFVSEGETGSWVNNWTQVEVRLPRESAARTLDLNTSDSAVLGGNFTGGLGAIVRGPGAVKFLGTRFDITNDDENAAGLTIVLHNPEAYTQYFAVIGCQIEENWGRGILIHAENDASLADDIMAIITACQFRNNHPGGAGAWDIQLRNPSGPIVRMPNIFGNSHTIPIGGQQVIKRVDYDPERWLGQPYGMAITRDEGNPTFWIGDKDRQAVLTLYESGEEFTNNGAAAGADFDLKTVTIPAYALGPNDALEIEADWSHTGSATNKILRVKLNGTIYTGFVQATLANIFTRTKTVIRANNSRTAQKGAPPNFAGGPGAATVAGVSSTHDMKLNQPLVFSCQVTTGGELITLRSYSVKVVRNIA